LKKTTRRIARSQNERKQYYRGAKGFGGEETEQKYDKLSLEGSDNPYPENDYSKTSEVKKSSVKSWIILNWKKVVAGIGTLIVAPLLVSLILWIINTKADIKYINRVIDDTKSQIESIEENINNNNSGDLYAVFATKELLDLKLELIEKDFKSLIPDTANIINRLSEIEEEIVSLQQLMEKNAETE
jgi:cell division protein FtsL